MHSCLHSGAQLLDSASKESSLACISKSIRKDLQLLCKSVSGSYGVSWLLELCGWFFFFFAFLNFIMF